MTDETTNQNVDEQEIQKTVQIVAYLDYPAGTSIRSIGEDMFPSVNWFEMRSWKTKDKVIHAQGQTFEVDDDLHDALLEADTGDVVVDTVEKHKSSFKTRENKLAKKIMNELMDDLPETLLEEYERHNVSHSYKNEEGDKCLTVFRYASEMPLLKTPDKIEEEDLYEDDVDRSVVKFKVRAYADNEDEMEEMQVLFIDQLVDLLGNLSYIDTVRWYNCKKKETTKGSCINI